MRGEKFFFRLTKYPLPTRKCFSLRRAERTEGEAPQARRARARPRDGSPTAFKRHCL